MDFSKLAAELERDEGLRLKPYRDSVGKLTIGIGRNLDDVGISADEARKLLSNDMARAECALDNALPWAGRLDEVRRRALVNMIFNLGIGGMLQFHNMLSALEVGDYKSAALEMLNSKWAGQVGERAKRLAEAIRTGVML